MSDDLYHQDEPRRLHPATIFIGWIRGLPRFVPALPALLVAREGRWMLAGSAAIFVISALFAWLHWRAFSYRIDGDALVIEQGILSRTRRAIPLERIQDVSIEQKPLQRLLRIVTVTIETGGGTADEGKLDSVGLAEAKRLRETLKSGVRPAAVSGEPVPELVAETPLFVMSFGRLLLFGAFSFSLVWMAALLAAVRFFDDFLPVDWDWVAARLDAAGHDASARFGIALILGAALLLLVLGFLSGIIGTVVRDFGFRLMAGEGRLRRVRGLLTRSEVAIAVRRVQLSLVQRRLVAGWLGYGRLQFQSLGGSDDKGGRQDMAPFATADEIERIVDAAGLPRFEAPGLKPVAAGHVVRALVRKALPYALVVSAAGLWLSPWAWWGLVLAPVILVTSLLVRRYHRYAMRERSVQVMRGVLKRREWAIPYGSVQAVSIRQGLLQRMLGIASVTIDTAGAARPLPHVEDAGTQDAIALATGLIERAG